MGGGGARGLAESGLGVAQGPCPVTPPAPNWSPLLPRSVRDECGVHLHSPAPGVAFHLGQLLRLRLHPGLGGLPPGASQRCHLCDLAEA